MNGHEECSHAQRHADGTLRVPSGVERGASVEAFPRRSVGTIIGLRYCGSSRLSSTRFTASSPSMINCAIPISVLRCDGLTSPANS